MSDENGDMLLGAKSRYFVCPQARPFVDQSGESLEFPEREHSSWKTTRDPAREVSATYHIRISASSSPLHGSDNYRLNFIKVISSFIVYLSNKVT